MENTIVLEVGIVKEACELTTVAMDHSKVKWAKVHVKWIINQIIVDIEEVGIHVISWCLAI